MTRHRMLLLALAVLPLSGLPVLMPAFTTAQAQDYLPPQNLEAPRSILPPRASNSQAANSSSAPNSTSSSSPVSNSYAVSNASSGSSSAAYPPSASSENSGAAYTPNASSGSSNATYAPPSNDNPGYGQPYSAPATANAVPSDGAPSSPPPGHEWGPPPPNSYSPSEILDAGRSFFGGASQGLAKVVEYSFQKNGRPTGYILGEEGSGAIVAGLRYGEGMLYQKGFPPQKVYWQGPSLGYDFGANGSKSFTLVYNLQYPSQIYERFAGIDGSAYLVGGVGITFQQHGDVVLAPIRAGLGLRMGANVGYLKYTASPTWNPF